MRIDIVTIFPKMVRGPLEEGIVARGIAKGLLDVVVHDLRDFTTDRHRVVDAGHGAHPLRDVVGEGAGAAHLERRGAGQVLHGVGEGGEHADVHHPDRHHEGHAQGHPGDGERRTDPVAAELAAGELQQDRHGDAVCGGGPTLRQVAQGC